jgi:hypothetical protein
VNTNDPQQLLDHAIAIKQQVETNWPAICAAALWLRTEIRNVAEYIIGHGGIGMLLLKLFWNPPWNPTTKS